MKICAYVQEAYAKQTYKNECMDTRQFVGLRVVIDALEKCGYTVEYAGIATVYRGFLTKQEIRTLRGQIKAGDVEAAKKGLEKIVRRRRGGVGAGGPP